MIMPDCRIFNSSRDFFTEFVRQNKQFDARRSFRNLSRKLQWPSSYLSDLVHGRKPLTVNRALEFTKAFDLADEIRDHLIHLAMADSHYPVVREYGQEKIARS